MAKMMVPWFAVKPQTETARLNTWAEDPLAAAFSLPGHEFPDGWPLWYIEVEVPDEQAHQISRGKQPEADLNN